MAKKKTAAESSKKSMAQALGAVGVAFGAISVLAPRKVVSGYGASR